MLKILWSLIIASSLVLPFMDTPYALGSAFMIIFTMCVAYFMSVGPTWYPATLFLVYMGGMMVLFMYMVCLSPNMRISMVSRKLMYAVLITTLLLWFGSKEGHTVVPIHWDASEMSKWSSSIQAPLEVSGSQGGKLMIFCSLCLFVTLLSVSSMCKGYKGPLRPFMRDHSNQEWLKPEHMMKKILKKGKKKGLYNKP